MGVGWGSVGFRQREQLGRTCKFRFLQVVQDALSVVGQSMGWGTGRGLLVSNEAGEDKGSEFIDALLSHIKESAEKHPTNLDSGQLEFFHSFPL